MGGLRGPLDAPANRVTSHEMNLQSIVVELIDVCNLNCAYCLRDEGTLHGRPHALPITDLIRALQEARTLSETCEVQFTGGEPTLHPEFRLAVKAVHDVGWRFTVITNGWIFGRVLPVILEFRDSLAAIAFSLDGVTREEHDGIRGKGSFERLMRGVMSCRHNGLAFDLKVTLDRSRAGRLSEFATFAAKLGARSLQVATLLPTSPGLAGQVLSIEQQQEILREISQLRTVLRLEIQVAADFYDTRPVPRCGPLLGRSLNIDYRGRLVLCTTLVGFRGQQGERDVIANLTGTSLLEALPRLSEIANERNLDRTRAFAQLGADAGRPSLSLGSPCLDCLFSFDKIPRGSISSSQEKKPMHDSLSFTIPDSIIASEFNGKEGLLLDTSTQRYHTLNETATFLWSEIEAGRTLSEMTTALCRAFAVDPPRARASIENAITRLESQSLIKRKSDLEAPDATRAAEAR